MTTKGACTVKTALLLTPANKAEMVVVPTESPVARPLEVIAATVELEEVQVARLVRFCVLPSE